MCSELECRICYRSYNTGRRCPRELQCKHSFCEHCLVILSRSSVCEVESEKECSRQDKTIVCPLCRYPTSVSGKVRAALPVDESVLECMVVSGVLEESMTDDEEDSEGKEEDDHNETPHENSAEERDSSSGSRGGRFRRSLRRIWGKFTGNHAQRRAHCMTDEELRDLMMSCYII
ncbi:E3 ubiquitin-protein ligase-like [Coregonus clupeaformis]|uniref:RING-type domain-containing protein n=1 Tax=Coregonus suidteri TaxID=861788 RepID=A0AAN8QJR9_9TELE|nr:E3 ubiquitin-protein ligase-like [Coregonus clupeaformis]